MKRNIRVGRLSHGGWKMELDIIAYNPHSDHLVHLEPSIDAHSWNVREERFKKKFSAGVNYIFTEVFTWLDQKTKIEQIAVLTSHPRGRDKIAGGKIVSIDELLSEIKHQIKNCGIISKNAIPERYPLLRTIQLVENGYFRSI